jgi:multiple sugar transport system ATP-binding protein
MTQITLRSIQKTYAGIAQVISNVDLDIAAGEFCVFLGPSGCGKSTLLRMIAGIETITDGDLQIGEVRVNDVPASKREVAMVFQSYALYPHMSLYENMAFGLRQAKVDPAEIDRRVREAAGILQITHLLDRLPKALSGGQRQRVAIGRAIVRQPKVFLFDEPLSNLDAALRVHMRAEIARLHRDFKTASAIYVTHDQTEAMALADKIVLLRAGEGMLKYGSVAQVGSPLELYHHPRDMFVAGFLGSPRMNFLPGVVVNSTKYEIFLQIDPEAGGESMRLPTMGRTVMSGQRVTLGVRPEHLTPTRSQVASITREVTQVEHFGECSYVYLDGVKGDDLIVKLSGHSTAVAGERMSFAVEVDAFHLFDTDGFTLLTAAE